MKILRIGFTGGERFILLHNISEVRRFVETYFRELKSDVFIGDISLLKVEAQSVLLKFIEEEVENIVCYASQDNINPVLMSRFDKIEKNENIKIGEDDFNTFLNHMREKESVVSVEREFLSKSGPYLDSFLLYRRLERGVINRVHDHL